MLLINKLTAPGGIRRVDLRPDTVRVVLYDGTERLYTNNRSQQHIADASTPMIEANKGGGDRAEQEDNNLGNGFSIHNERGG